MNNIGKRMINSPKNYIHVISEFFENSCLFIKQLVVLGNGDRVWGGAQDSEVLFSCPRLKLATLIEGLEATHAAGLRYPIPAYMNYKPGFQAAFKKRALDRAGGTIIKEK